MVGYTKYANLLAIKLEDMVKAYLVEGPKIREKKPFRSCLEVSDIS